MSGQPDLQQFLRQLQQTGQATPPSSAGAPEASQPAASQWAYLAFLMQQQAQQAQQQHRPAPADVAGILAAIAADPAAAQSLAPLLTAMMAKPAGGGDGEAKASGQEGDGGDGGAFQASGEAGSSKPDGGLDPSAILPLLQLQAQQAANLGVEAAKADQGAASDGGGATPSAQGGIAKSAKEKNRAAQRRFRERQKGLIADLKAREEALAKQCAEQKQQIEALQHENAVLKDVVHGKAAAAKA